MTFCTYARWLSGESATISGFYLLWTRYFYVLTFSIWLSCAVFKGSAGDSSHEKIFGGAALHISNQPPLALWCSITYFIIELKRTVRYTLSGVTEVVWDFHRRPPWRTKCSSGSHLSRLGFFCYSHSSTPHSQACTGFSVTGWYPVSRYTFPRKSWRPLLIKMYRACLRYVSS